MSTTDSYFIQGPITPTRIASLYEEMSHFPGTGGINSFSGQVRNDLIGDKTVAAIEYSAYEPMANEAFAAIAKEAKEKFDLHHLFILHSLGRVNAGEIGLFVLVAAPHRQPTFDGLHFVVEAIKANVPIFGKELFADDSHVWKENR